MKELWLFTQNFPMGRLENSVGHELPALQRHFAPIRIIPMFEREGMRPLPAGVELVRPIVDPFAVATPFQVLHYWRAWSLMAGAVRRSAPSEAIFLAQRRENWSRMRQALHRTIALRRRLGSAYDPQRVVLHSNWAADWATVLGLWKAIDPRVRFCTRMRGFDMFDHRVPGGWQVFRSFHMAQAEHVYTVSTAGRDHIVERHPLHAQKVSVAHTATQDHGQGPWRPDPAFRIVSCANLVALKRVHVLAEAIAQLPFPVQWTHFGDGVERGRIDALVAAMPAHVQVELPGAVNNEVILAHYATRPVDLFVHTSETEGGVAVALQEAASFGIPLLAADAGGVNELVNASTGELLPNSIDATLLAKHIAAWHARGHDPVFRNGVRQFWLAHFEAERVHERFAMDLATR